jgi:invasion protein IalB
VQRRRHTALPIAALLLTLAGAASGEGQDGARFRDWTVRCEEATEGGQTSCVIVQRLLLKEQQQRLLDVAVGYLLDGKPAAFFVLPLGVSLPGGISITVDGGKPVRLRYEYCDGSGCLAPLALSEEMLGAFQGGRWARVAFFSRSGKEISVPVSLLGFTAGFRALR